MEGIYLSKINFSYLSGFNRLAPPYWVDYFLSVLLAVGADRFDPWHPLHPPSSGGSGEGGGGEGSSGENHLFTLNIMFLSLLSSIKDWKQKSKMETSNGHERTKRATKRVRTAG